MIPAPGWTRGSLAGLAGLVALALALRLPGVDAHLPDIYWHDELNFIEGGLRVGAGEIVAASYGGYSHGTLTYYLLFGAFAAFYMAGRIAGVFHGPDDLLMSYVTDPSAIILIARVVMLAATLVTVGFTGALARRLFGPRGGLIAAGLLAVSFQSVQITLGKEDGLFALLVLITVWFAVRVTDVPDSRARLIALGAIAGAATAVKYFGVFLLPLMAVTVVVAGTRPQMNELLRRTALGCAAFIAVFLVLVPGFLLDAERFISSFRALATINTATTLSVTGVEASPWYGYLWDSLAVSNGVTATALFYAAAIWFLRRSPREAIVLLVYPATLFAALTMTLAFGRPAAAVNFYQVSALPLLCIVGAGFLDDLLSSGRIRRLAGAAALLTILVTNAGDDVRFQRLLALTDTRTLAREWIEQHLPEGTSILIEGAISTFVLEGPQLHETEASLGRELAEIRQQGGGGGLWSAKVRAARLAGGPRRFDVYKVRNVTTEHLHDPPAYVVTRSDQGRRLLDSDARYRAIFAATSDAPSLFRSAPLLSSADIARLRQIPLAGDPRFTPGPDIRIYQLVELRGTPTS